MKIFSVQQTREADAFTLTHEPIASIDLMERAANACVHWMVERYTNSTGFKVVCGLGNNGGDGLAIARLLFEKNYKVEVFIIKHTEKQSDDFKYNLNRLKELKKIGIHEVADSSAIRLMESSLSENEVFVDALFGSGLNKPVEGLIAEVIHFINRQYAPIISIDVPSGLFCDELNDRKNSVVRATYTLTFQFPKLSFMFPETIENVGEFSVLDIGIHSEYIHSTQTRTYFTTKNDVLDFYKVRSKAAHKGDFGHALLIAGSYGKIGASVLASKACLKTGVGLLTAYIPKCGYGILQSTVPEAMVITDSETNFITETISVEKYNAIGIGPGIGTERQTQNVVKLLIQNTTVPIVFDADAINCIAENKTWLSFVPVNSVFTPHVKEFERLVGKADNSFERLKMQREFSMKYGVYIVLKGAHTSISSPDGNVFFNSTGNPGMATGGSGDVLTGIITSLMAKGYSAQEACILGVYLHGLAGDFAADGLTEESMIASDIIEHLSNAYKFIKE
jgi:hydroxyethylthiazole kinase-like uncharacterized protein yjeF